MREDRIYLAQFRFGHGGPAVGITWVSRPITADRYDKLKGIFEEEGDGATESLADLIEERPWDLLTDRWVTADPGGFAGLADLLAGAQSELKVCLLARPLDAAQRAAGLGDLPIVTAVAEHLPIPRVDETFSEVRHCIEAAGILAMVLSGGHFLACASLKMLAHDQLGRLLGHLLRDAAECGNSENEGVRPDSADERRTTRATRAQDSQNTGRSIPRAPGAATSSELQRSAVQGQNPRPVNAIQRLISARRQLVRISLPASLPLGGIPNTAVTAPAGD